MLSLILSTLILSAEPNQPTEVIGSAATPDHKRKEVIVKQPEYAPDPFGYIAPTPTGGPTDYTITDTPQTSQPNTTTTAPSYPTPLVSQTSTTDPLQMSRNPLDYENKIENTIYQDGDRLLDVQSIPIQDINTALTPNTQPTISNYPAF